MRQTQPVTPRSVTTSTEASPSPHWRRTGLRAYVKARGVVPHQGRRNESLIHLKWAGNGEEFGTLGLTSLTSIGAQAQVRTRRTPPVALLHSLTRIFPLGYILGMLTTLSALAEPNRLHIVELLRDGPRPVGEIAERLGLRQPQASKHLRVLSDAGFVEVHPVAQQRIYQLRPQPFRELETWLASYRHVWDARFDRLESYLRDMQQAPEQEQEQHHDDKP